MAEAASAEWKYHLERQMQDNDDAERNAFQTLTNGKGITLDCSVHLLREAKHRIKGDRKKKVKEEANMQAMQACNDESSHCA